MKKKNREINLLNVKLIFNIILTLLVIFWIANMIWLIVPSAGQSYWPWFCTSIFILVERWVMYFMFEAKTRSIRQKLNKINIENDNSQYDSMKSNLEENEVILDE